MPKMMKDKLRFLKVILLVSILLPISLAGCSSTEEEPIITQTINQSGTQTPAPNPSETQTISPGTPTETTTPAPDETPFEFKLGERYKVQVVDVIDGDTIDVVLPDGSEERVRLLGIDSPEVIASQNKMGEYDNITDLECLENWGIEAKRYVTSIVEGSEIELELDSKASLRDTYDRILAYVFYENYDLNAELIKNGYARVYTEEEFNMKSEYMAYQESADNTFTGLWDCRVKTTPEPEPSIPGIIDIFYIHEKTAGSERQNLNDEYIIFKNVGSIPVDMTGWKLKDAIDNTYTFPDFVIQPGKTFTVHTGKGENTQTDLYWGSEEGIWNDGGDIITLLDATGQIINSEKYQ